LLENTKKQVQDFYSDEDNIWSTMRKQYKIRWILKNVNCFMKCQIW